MKHDFQELRREVDRWSSSELAALSRWEKAQWNACGDPSDGHHFDTIGDAAGARFQVSLNKRDELIGLVLMAEGADSAGDADRVEALVCELYRNLGRSEIPRVSGFTDALDFEFDPHPPTVADISLLKTLEHDYDALRCAVENWRDVELRTAGDGAGMWFSDVQSKAHELHMLIRQAEACERQGDAGKADALADTLYERLGIADETSVQIEAFLHNATCKASIMRHRTVLAWVCLSIVGTATAAFALFG